MLKDSLLDFSIAVVRHVVFTSRQRNGSWAEMSDECMRESPAIGYIQ